MRSRKHQLQGEFLERERKPMGKNLFILAVAAMLVFVSAGTVDASAEHGRINGFVRTESGKRLSDVRVTVTSPNMMGEREDVSNRRGRFRFRALPIGNYVLKFEHEDMKTMVRTQIAVRPYSTVTVRLNMVEGSPDEIEIVDGPSDLIDVSTTSSRETRDGDFSNRLPGSTLPGESGTRPF
jgi:hypothetical protein